MPESLQRGLLSFCRGLDIQKIGKNTTDSVFFKENVRFSVWTCRDPISDSRDPIFSDSRDPMIIFCL